MEAESLFSQRSVLEEQDPATLLLLREQLHNKVARTLGSIALVEDVLAGYGKEVQEIHDERTEDY